MKLKPIQQHDSTEFTKFKAEACQKFNALNTGIQIAENPTDVARVMEYICQGYKKEFPKLDPSNSSDYIISSFNFYTEDQDGNINGTISLVVDSEHGFPEEHLLKDDIQPYRDRGLRTYQLGRLVVNGSNNRRSSAIEFFKVLYLLPRLNGDGVVFGTIKSKEISLHEKRFGAKVLNRHTGENYGGKHEFATVAWELDKLRSLFFTKTNCQKIEHTIYQQQEWDEYANAFGSVQTIYQRELQTTAKNYLSGEVADFGCGTAKLAPFLSDEEPVEGYIGIDYSPLMVKCANDLISSLKCPSFSAWEGKIEDYQGKLFDSAVSLNSFYSWPEPEKTLAHIATLLKPGGIFVLATPNKKIKEQMPNMLKEATKELYLHPYWPDFEQQNLAFVDNPDAHFIDMDDLIEKVQAAGFAIQSCHQSFYLGALNFLILERKVEQQALIAA